ncbi:uncharacterized protein PG998_014928 [Apiospora kogelbergensis]|uniref:uncharacterized protein n=1 Tax=Apiospora kogelbergensis TaxID=1337665 RepID=UPI00312E7AD2
MATAMGLSVRGAANVDAILPRISAAVEERAKKENTNIDLGTSENWLIRDELIALSKDAHLSYPDGFGGDSSLMEALAGFFNRYFKPILPVAPTHLATAPGAAASLDALLYNICEPMDGVLVPGPFWNGFDWLFSVRSGVQPVTVNVDNIEETFTASLIPKLEAAYKHSENPIKALVLTNPHNPFGQCYPRSVIEECIKFCYKQKIHFVSDEVYAVSELDNPSSTSPVPFISALAIDVASIGCDPSRVHVIWSISKDFGSSGFRMGCCVTQHNRAMQVGAALAANTQVSSLTAIFTTALLNSSKLPSLLKTNASRLADAYNTVKSVFDRLGLRYIPVSHGPFIFVRIAPNATSWEEESLAISCCKEMGVVLSPGKAYHIVDKEKGWTRLTFAIKNDQLEEALRRLEAGLALFHKRLVLKN